MSEQNEMPERIYMPHGLNGRPSLTPLYDWQAYLRNDYGDDGRVVSRLIVKELDLANDRIAELQSKLLQLEDQKHRAIVEQDGLRENLSKAREIMRFVEDVISVVENDELGEDDCYRVGVFAMSNLHALVRDYQAAEKASKV